MKKDDCIFCKIANGEIPSATVYETPECRVILDLAPANQDRKSTRLNSSHAT